MERLNQTLIGRIRRIYAEGTYADWTETLPEAVAAIRSSVHRVLHMTPQEIWNSGPTTWTKIKAQMKQACEEANRRLHLYKRHNYIDQNVWIWHSERMKQLNYKFAPFWTGPWTLVRRLSHVLWEAEHHSTHRRRIVHSDHLQPYY